MLDFLSKFLILTEYRETMHFGHVLLLLLAIFSTKLVEDTKQIRISTLYLASL